MKVIQYICLFVGVFFFIACEEPFDPDFSDQAPTVVIEGYLQSGADGAETLPPYVTIAKTYPLFQTDDEITGPELFLGGASVRVKNNGNTYLLSEICTANLDPVIKEQVLEILGIDTILAGLDICFYVDFNQAIPLVEGDRYDLEIDFEDQLITASTTIPPFVKIDSIKVYDQFGIEGYRSMNAFLTDPVGPNYYRLKASVNGSNFTADFSSVTDDIFFEDKSFDFPINKPTDRTMDFDPNVAGLFAVGDTAVLEWQTLDKEHFNFWNSLEFARGNQGPFSSYSRADSNIDGAIGIWGGSSIKYYTEIVK